MEVGGGPVAYEGLFGEEALAGGAGGLAFRDRAVRARGVAAIAAETMTLFGVPAQLEGNLIRVSSGLVGVNEACSGVRSLQTSLMIGLLVR